jgi:hypothetical protein
LKIKTDEEIANIKAENADKESEYVAKNTEISDDLQNLRKK